MLFTEVIKDNRIFLRCFKKGNFVSCDYITAYFIPNKSPFNRIGISVGKKQGKAVERNRIKRIIRAAYRLNEDRFPIGYDIVFSGRNDISTKKTQDIEFFINKRLLKKMNCINSCEKQRRKWEKFRYFLFGFIKNLSARWFRQGADIIHLVQSIVCKLLKSMVFLRVLY